VFLRAESMPLRSGSVYEDRLSAGSGLAGRRVQAWDSGFKGHARSFADAFLAKLWFDLAGD
jgi:hypothetical protein